VFGFTPFQSEPTTVTTTSSTHQSTIEYWYSKQLGQSINGESAGDWSGWSLALTSDGMTLAIGAPFGNDNGNDSGSVRVFYRDNGLEWRKLGQTIIGDASNDRLGMSVALSANGTTLAVGAVWNSGYAEYSGQVKILKLDGDSSSWKISQVIYGATAYDVFGEAISLSADGKTIAVGAQWSDVRGSDSGYVRVFEENDDSNWAYIGQGIFGDVAGDRFGSSVSLSADGKILAIGVRSSDHINETSGQVVIYERTYDTSNWKQRGQVIYGEKAEDFFGSSVSLSAGGRTLAIGAVGNDRNGVSSGHVKVYGWDDDWSSWIQLGKTINGEAAGDNAGHSVSISNDGKTLAIGAPWSNDNGEKSGCARLYQWDEAISDYGKLAQDIVGDAAGDEFGWSVALSADGGTVAVGADGSDGNGIDSGQVKVFRVGK